MRLLIITQGEYGKRIVDNICAHRPDGWAVEDWRAPANLPLVMDYSEEMLPETLPPSDLVLSLGENPGVAELVPEVVKRTGATAVIAPVDRSEWLPKGLARQLEGWLQQLHVAAVFPKPLCSLTETHYNVGRHRVAYSDPLISEFARHFGRPRFVVSVDTEGKAISGVCVERDATCGCARYVAGGLASVAVDSAEFEAGMLHHHYPCLASMGIDDDFADTLMHVSGHIMQEELLEQLKPYVTVQYYTPHGKVDE
jgi:hypothetical protein